jgi:hypothetical protein
LNDWQKNGWLQPHQTSREEVSELAEAAQELYKDLHIWLAKNYTKYL